MARPDPDGATAREAAAPARSCGSLKESLYRLLRAADAALRTPVGDVAWDELAQVVAAEHAALSAGLGRETMDGMRSRILADAECVRATLADARISGSRASAAQRRTVKFCRNMRSEIEKLSFSLQEQAEPGQPTAARDR